jgi:hypothetical protein
MAISPRYTILESVRRMMGPVAVFLRSNVLKRYWKILNTLDFPAGTVLKIYQNCGSSIARLMFCGQSPPIMDHKKIKRITDIYRVPRVLFLYHPK